MGTNEEIESLEEFKDQLRTKILVTTHPIIINNYLSPVEYENKMLQEVTAA